MAEERYTILARHAKRESVMKSSNIDRRGALVTLVGVGAGALTVGCGRKANSESQSTTRSATVPGAVSSATHSEASASAKDEDVGAVEDLMREHGVIRRVLVVYRETARKVRDVPVSVPPEPLRRAATLIRTFAEDYHERKLEEAILFPALVQARPEFKAEVDALNAQHQRGRDVTDYILTVVKDAIGQTNAEPLARALESFSRMYEAHAAREDTVIFPAWKKTLSKHRLHELGEQFEGIEHQTFGKDGFDDAVEQITAIEKELNVDFMAMLPSLPPANPRN